LHWNNCAIDKSKIALNIEDNSGIEAGIYGSIMLKNAKKGVKI
jgi:hypothetical protein